MIDSAFLNWFAGFVDGEGCFHLSRIIRDGRNYYRPVFRIVLRDDDDDIVYQIVNNLRMGKVYRRDQYRENWSPQIILAIEGTYNCRKLCDIFDDHPLRAKKLKDYQIWRKFVHLDCVRKGGKNQAYWSNGDLRAAETLRLCLIEGRKYGAKRGEEKGR